MRLFVKLLFQLVDSLLDLLPCLVAPLVRVQTVMQVLAFGMVLVSADSDVATGGAIRQLGVLDLESTHLRTTVSVWNIWDAVEFVYSVYGEGPLMPIIASFTSPVEHRVIHAGTIGVSLALFYFRLLDKSTLFTNRLTHRAHPCCLG